MASTSMTRRGLLRGVTTASVLPGCVQRHSAVPNSESFDPGRIGPDPSDVTFTLNGATVTVASEPRTTLLQALRIDLNATGTKQVCDRGACGACIVHVDGIPRNACMTLVHDVAGRQVTTVEGLAVNSQLSALQAAFIQHDALQCGFCTSGMLMTCTALLRTHDGKGRLTREQVERAIAGNLCRCGTYPQVVAAVMEVANGAREA